MRASPTVPNIRVRALNRCALRPDADYVLYWMIAARRSTHSFALQHARDLAVSLHKPLLVLEALRVDYPHASPRLHAFVLQGMADNLAAFARTDASYVPYVEASSGAGRGLVEALAERACAVVTDDFPAFFLRPMVEATAERVHAPLFSVDGNGLLPMRSATRAWPTARGFRRFLHQQAAVALAQVPERDPLAGVRLPRLRTLPEALRTRFTPCSAESLAQSDALAQSLPLDARVGITSTRGGSVAAHAQLERFVRTQLWRYGEARNHPDDDATSGLSPYLHFGHLSTHAILDAVLAHEDAGDPIARLDPARFGEREQLFALSPSAEAFVEQLLVWRELAYNGCAFVPRYAQYDTLPPWARATLAKHARDRRDPIYTLEQLEGAQTYDEIWNAAQRQLVREGRMHNYLRMLWGKKVLEWSATPEQAFEQLIVLNDRWALDGRDPNSYAGISWTFGRYDRAWGPERPIFGTIRYMSSDNTRRKLHLRSYLARYRA